MDEIEIELAVDRVVADILFERIGVYVPSWVFNRSDVIAVIRRSVAECIDSQRFGLLDDGMIHRIVMTEFDNVMEVVE